MDEQPAGPRKHLGRRVARVLPYGLLVLQLILGVAVTGRATAAAVLRAWEARNRTLEGSFVAAGAEYWRGVLEIRSRIRPGERYVLLDGEGEGGHVILQGDLAPREALWFPPRATSEPPDRWRKLGIPPWAPHHLVVYRGLDRAPELHEVRVFYGADR